MKIIDIYNKIKELKTIKRNLSLDGLPYLKFETKEQNNGEPILTVPGKNADNIENLDLLIKALEIVFEREVAKEAVFWRNIFEEREHFTDDIYWKIKVNDLYYSSGLFTPSQKVVKKVEPNITHSGSNSDTDLLVTAGILAAGIDTN